MTRSIACLMWTAHSWFWIYRGDGALFVPELALVGLLSYSALRLFGRVPMRIIIPLAAALSVAPIPVHSAAMQVKDTPAGVVALAFSFVLFGLGTVFALWRAGAGPNDSFRPVESSPRQN
ncbi:MAG: hypothetical protein HY735_06395 [Verrucomicrobia bacterium]|nr:hypothetical protein [Verrucomicrobiota bacterium]